MTDTFPIRDLAGIKDPATLAPEVRAYLTVKIQGLLEGLEPYVDGTFEISPAMATVYLRAARELGLLYRAYEAPKVVDEPVAVSPQQALEAKRAQVLGQLEELAARAAE